MLEDLRFEVSAAMAGKQIAADAACVRGPNVLGDSLIGPDRRAVRMIVLAFYASADQNGVGTDVQKRLGVHA